MNEFVNESTNECVNENIHKENILRTVFSSCISSSSDKNDFVITDYSNELKVNKIKMAYMDLAIDDLMTVNILSTSCDGKYGEHYLALTFYKNKKVTFSKKEASDEIIVYPTYGQSYNKIIFYDNGNIFQEFSRKNIPVFIPLSIKMAKNFIQTYGNTFSKFINSYLNWMTKKNVFYNDIRNNVIYKEMCNIPPMNFNEFQEIHNMNELMNKKYKNANEINWNKNNIDINYLIMKSAPYLTEESKRMLYGMKNQIIINKKFNNMKIQYKVIDFLKHIILLLNNFEPKFCYDYLKYCIKSKTKIDLKFKSKEDYQQKCKLANSNYLLTTIHNYNVTQDNVFSICEVCKDLHQIKTTRELKKYIRENGVWIDISAVKFDADSIGMFTYFHKDSNQKYIILITNRRNEFVVNHVITNRHEQIIEEIKDNIVNEISDKLKNNNIKITANIIASVF